MYHLNDNLQIKWKKCQRIFQKLKFTKKKVFFFFFAKSSIFSHYLDVVKYPVVARNIWVTVTGYNANIKIKIMHKCQNHSYM